MNINKILSETFLFSGIETDRINTIISDSPPEIISYKRGETVYSSADPDRKVGFVASGKVDVRIERHDGAKTLLNSLYESDSFGVLSVYSSEEFPTKIYAAKNCTIIFFSAEQIDKFVKNYSQISANLINFLAERISFLNRKIATLSQGRVDDKLAAHLLSESKRCGSVTIDLNCSKISEIIGVGRASVYRALACLEAEGLIISNNKKIQILDLDGLERMTK